jgi:hypothetical protein
VPFQLFAPKDAQDAFLSTGRGKRNPNNRLSAFLLMAEFSIGGKNAHHIVERRVRLPSQD